MKRFASILPVLLLAFVCHGQQIYRGGNQIPINYAVGFTNLQGQSVSNATATIEVEGQTSLIQCTVQADAATTDACTLSFKPSVDGSTLPTKDYTEFKLIVQMNGPTGRTIITNWTCPWPYLKLEWITNAAATAKITNIVLKAGSKRL